MVQLAAWLALAAAVLTFPRAFRFRGPLAFVFVFVFMAQCVCFYLTGEPFGRLALAHCNGKVALMVLGYGYGLTPFLLFLGSAGLVLFAQSRAARCLDRRPFWRWGVVLTALVALSWPGGILNGGASAFGEWWMVRSWLRRTETMTLPEALLSVNVSPGNFVENGAVEAKPGRNVVVLCLESFSRAFLERPELTPGLNRLGRRWTRLDDFSHVACEESTSSALYVGHTGFPYPDSVPESDYFSRGYVPRLPGLGRVFGRAGYECVALMSAPSFMGKDAFLKSYGFTVRGGPADFPPGAAVDHWGVRDLDLYRLAREEYLRLSRGGRPFVLWMITVDTHFPDVRGDPETLAGAPAEWPMVRRAIWAADRRVAEFAEFLEQQDNAADTAVFIFPDHCHRGYSPLGIANLPKDLFVLANAPRERLGAPATRRFTHMDLPRLILNGAEVEGNVRFLGELLPWFRDDDGYRRFFRDYRYQLLALNRLLWEPKR